MDFLFERFATAKDRPALIHDDHSWTYGAMLDRIDEHARALAEVGVEPGAIVALSGPYTPDVVCLLLALLRHRAVVVPITPDSVVEQSAMLDLGEVEWVAECAPGRAAPAWSRRDVRPRHPMLLDLIAGGAPGLILFTSGSTGTPKAILHDAARVAAKFREPRTAQVVLAFLTLDHFGGINTLLGILSSLGTVVTVAQRSLRSVCTAIERHRVELLPATPSFLTMLVQSNAAETFDLGSLRLITYGTEVMPQATLDRLRTLFPAVRLQQTYGLSELGVLRSRSREDGSLWMRMGGEGFQLKVVDGILWIKSDFAMLGYLNAPSPFDEDGWFNTTDQVEVDGEYLRVLGRVSDIINVAGQKVYPAEVEEVILRLDNIVDVAVRGEASRLIGSMVVAHVKLHEPEPLDALKARIRQACARSLAAYKVPTKVVLADDEFYSRRGKKMRGTVAESA